MNSRLTQLQILLVDDEPQILNLYRRLLEIKGHTCLSANNGQQAIDIMTERPVDILITDAKMPGISGAELLKWVCEHSPDTRRIMISGDAGIERRTSEMLSSGLAHRIVKKPCDAATFYEAFTEQVNKVPIG